AKLAHRRWLVACAATGSTDPRVRGIAPLPEPEDFTAPSAPCQGAISRPGVFASGDIVSPRGRLAAA
ncbi:MAG: hypothetical protein KC442_21380, partial [Thermomicrobiales bacterium]|nr:hypothetical protein [Thermomicrobiales bacterium]